MIWAVTLVLNWGGIGRKRTYLGCGADSLVDADWALAVCAQLFCPSSRINLSTAVWFGLVFKILHVC